ncbi:hypothetical protein EDC01DRAFT_635773 [Geopyxis carbonaria]|nr:hypothetical protein EDC01DRAFT_635773 [Geopyxis carbonaria]
MVSSEQVPTINYTWIPDSASYMKAEYFHPDHEIFDNFIRIGGKGSDFVYVWHELTKELVSPCCITEFQDMNHYIHQDFSRVFKYLHEDKKFNSQETSNGAHRGSSGKMRCLGWRTEYRAEEVFGHYVLEDKDNQFYIEYILIASTVLPLAYHKINKHSLRNQECMVWVTCTMKTMITQNNPSYIIQIYHTLVIYYVGFVNMAYCDQDVSTYTHGISAFVDTDTGQMASCKSTGEIFYIADYAVVNYDIAALLVNHCGRNTSAIWVSPVKTHDCCVSTILYMLCMPAASTCQGVDTTIFDDPTLEHLIRNESCDNDDRDIIIIHPILQFQPKSQDAVQRIEDIVSTATQIQSKQDILNPESKGKLEDPTVSEDYYNINEFYDYECDNGIEDEMLETDEIQNIIQ